MNYSVVRNERDVGYPCSLLMAPLRYAFRGKTCEWRGRVLQIGGCGSIICKCKLVATDAIVFMRNVCERCRKRYACVADSKLLESSFFPARDRISFVNQLPYLDCESKQQHGM